MVNSEQLEEDRMSEMKQAASFRDLVVYQKARELQQEIFLITRSFPRKITPK